MKMRIQWRIHLDYNLVIDADSILYTSCYNSQLVNKKSIGVEHSEEARKASFNIEKAYMYFCSKVARIEAMVYLRHKEEHIKGEWRGKPIIDGLVINTSLFFSPKHTFRNDLSPIYKANRKPSEIFGIGDLKKLVMERYGAIEIPNLEADDLVITEAYEKENDCINYNEWEWYEGLEQETIEENYIYQAILGDSTDNIKGCKGKGKAFADKFVNNALEPWTYESWMNLYENSEEAILQMQLIRLDQYKKGELELWSL